MYACRCPCQVDPLKLERRPGHLMVTSRGNITKHCEGKQLEGVEKRPYLELVTTICLRGRSSQAFSKQQVLPNDLKGRGSQRGQDLKFISPNSTSVLPKAPLSVHRVSQSSKTTEKGLMATIRHEAFLLRVHPAPEIGSIPYNQARVGR